MASTLLTDEELFSELKRFGFTPGPVTENTRPVYLKKLKKLREEQQQRGCRTGKSRSSSAIINTTGGGGGTAASRPVTHDVTHLSSSRRPGRKSSILGFSSDESDAEAPHKSKGRDYSGRASRSSGVQKQANSGPVTTLTVAIKRQYDTGTTLNSNSSLGPDGQRSILRSWDTCDRSNPDVEGRHYDESGEEDVCEEESEKNSRSLNGRGASRMDASKVAGDYSDSDEEVGGLGAGDRNRDRLVLRLSQQIVPSPSHVAERESPIDEKNSSKDNPPDSLNMQKIQGMDEEEVQGNLGLPGGPRCHSFPRKSVYVSLADNHRGKIGKNNHINDNDGSPRSNSTRYSIGLRPRFSNYSLPQTYRGNHSNHTLGSNNSYSQTVRKKKLDVPEDELLQQFKREELASPGSFSAHYLSMFLLTTACLFFLLLGLMYLRMRGSGSAEVDGVSKYFFSCVKRSEIPRTFCATWRCVFKLMYYSLSLLCCS